MGAYEPGTIAAGRVDGHPSRLLRSGHGWHFWQTEIDRPSGFAADEASYPPVTDVRPLIVLDLDGYDGERAVNYLRNLARESVDIRTGGATPSPRGKLANLIADQIEAQTKPPRMAEPGLWGVVEAGVAQHDKRLQWSRDNEGFWECRDRFEYDRVWDDLIDPVLVRDGIEDES